jgi:hypothetical protein
MLLRGWRGVDIFIIGKLIFELLNISNWLIRKLNFMQPWLPMAV